MLARSSLWAVLLLMACMPCAFGQLPKTLEKCLPYPTLAQEIRDTQPAPARVKIHVVRVEFDPDDGIPADAQEEISAELQSNLIEPEADSAYVKNLAEGIAEVGIRGRLRDRGYFKATATAKATKLWSDATEIGVVAAIRVVPGRQYRTEDIRIESTDPANPLAMSPEVLRGLIPLQRRELFSTARVRAGLENLARAYGREGYVDMTPETDTQVDDARGTVDLVIKIDQQTQYRFGSIEFLGLNDVTQGKFRESLPQPGEVFDRTKFDEFFQVNRTILPPDASRDDVTVERDNEARTVRILFDFRACPQHSNLIQRIQQPHSALDSRLSFTQAAASPG